MFAEISLVNGLDVGPIVLDCDLLELGFVLIVPGPVVFFLLLGEGTSVSHMVFAAVGHFDVFGDELLVGDLGVALNKYEVVLIFLVGDEGEIATLDLSFVEAIEEGEWDVFVLVVLEFPVDPLFVLYLEILQDAKVHFHEAC